MNTMICKIPYLNEYRGKLIDDIPSVGEENFYNFTFLDIDNTCYANPFVYNKEQRNYGIPIEQLLDVPGLSVVGNVLVIFVALTPGIKNRGFVVIGWYKNAKVFRNGQAISPTLLEYFISCETSDAFLLEPEKRNHVIPKEIDFADSKYVFPPESICSNLEMYVQNEKSDRINVCLDDYIKSYLLIDATVDADVFYAKCEEMFDLLDKSGDILIMAEAYAMSKLYIEHFPDDLYGWKYAGDFLLEMLRPESAIYYLKKAYTYQNDNEKTLLQLGEAYFETYKHQEAIFYFNEALTILPEDKYTMIKLADAYTMGGYTQMAYNIFNKIEEPDEELTNFVKKMEQELPYLTIRTKVDLRNRILEISNYELTIDFESMIKPEIKKRDNGKLEILDWVRKRFVNYTPEEIVRQNVIKYLMDVLGVPVQCIKVEENLSHVDKSMKDRVDILVFLNGRKSEGKNILLIECKEPRVPLDGSPMEQVLRYNEYINADFVMLTNGYTTRIYHTNIISGEYETLRKIPTFQEMCLGKDLHMIDWVETGWKRPSWETLQQPEYINSMRLDGTALGSLTPLEIAPFICNLYYAILDQTERIPDNYSVEDSTILHDYGIKYATISNPSGGNFPGHYRWMSVENKKHIQANILLNVFGVGKSDNDSKFGNGGGYSSLVVAIEHNGSTISILEVRLDYYAEPNNNGYHITHDGRRSRKKSSDMLDYVAAMNPDLLNQEGVVDFGWLDNSCNLSLSQPATQRFFGRVISYALLRYELRCKENSAK